MNRRQALGAAIAGGLTIGAAARSSAQLQANPAPKIPLPKGGKVKVAFVISSGANVIDLAGPWETFADTMLPDGDMPFELFTVAETTQIVEMTDGLRVEPTYSFDAVSRPNVVVVPAQSNASERFMALLREIQGQVDLTMSVCTGAFKLAKAGILDGKSATTHHDYYDQFARQFPRVTLVRGPRFVDEGSIITAGGLTSGISAALHVVSRYFDATYSARTAAYMEFVPTVRPA